MRATPLNSQSLGGINHQIQVALDSGKAYQVSITKFDNSLRGRQRALANIWYKEIDDFLGDSVGQAEAYCKYRFGLKIATREDAERAVMFRKLLDGYAYCDKLAIIRDFSEMFPIMRAKGGLNADDQAEYLNCVQRHFAEQGLILSSPKQRDLLHCKESNQ